MAMVLDPDSITIVHFWTLCFESGLMVLALGDSFLKARSGKEARVDDLG